MNYSNWSLHLEAKPPVFFFFFNPMAHFNFLPCKLAVPTFLMDLTCAVTCKRESKWCWTPQSPGNNLSATRDDCVTPDCCTVFIDRNKVHFYVSGAAEILWYAVIPLQFQGWDPVWSWIGVWPRWLDRNRIQQRSVEQLLFSTRRRWSRCGLLVFRWAAGFSCCTADLLHCFNWKNQPINEIGFWWLTFIFDGDVFHGWYWQCNNVFFFVKQAINVCFPVFQ